MALAASSPAFATQKPFKLRFMLASSLYGKTPLAEILPEMKTLDISELDVWPKRHGSQREEIDALGIPATKKLLDRHGVQLSAITRFDLGLPRLAEEIPVAKELGAKMLVTGVTGAGLNKLKGDELKAAIKKTIAESAPLIATAEKEGVVVAVENHAGGLLATLDSIRWFAELSPSPSFGIAFAPYHLPQEPAKLADCLRALGPKLALFYAWQHGKGCMTAQPKADELLQLPGRGNLDFTPVLAALASIDYSGPTEVFMHPFPRGIPILPTVKDSTAELLRAQRHLEQLPTSPVGRTP